MSSRLLLFLLSSCLFFSCRYTTAGFPFATVGEEMVTISYKGTTSQEPDGALAGVLAGGSAGKSTEETGERVSPLFVLSSAVSTDHYSEAFVLRYRSTVYPVSVSILNKKMENVATFILPDWDVGEKWIEYRYALDHDTSFRYFQLSSPEQEGNIDIAKAGLLPDIEGVQFSENLVIGNRMFESVTVTADSLGRYSVSFSIHTHDEVSGSSSSSPLITIDYRNRLSTESPPLVAEGSTGVEQSRDDPISVTCMHTTNRISYRYFPRNGDGQLAINPTVIGFYPETVLLRNIPAQVVIQKIRFQSSPYQQATQGEEHLRPIPIEIGEMNRIPVEKWRTATHELFRWSLFPRMLIIDTIDYTFQSNMFKRLAFFVEKYGYTGEIYGDHIIEEKHGWNAHDYRAVDLACFFRKAADSRFPLSEEERLLQSILLQHGIVEEQEGRITAGKGGVLSVSRSSSDYLRNKFLIHECLHGVFFSSPDYEQACFILYDKLSDELQSFWRFFLQWLTYNSDDRYLVVNEYQAYLMQQPIEEAEQYFRRHPATKFALENSPYGQELQNLLSKNKDLFTKMAEEVAAVAETNAGITQEKLWAVFYSEE